MKTVILPGLLLISILSLGQDYPRKDLHLERLADEIFPAQDLNLNYGELYENLAQLLARPLDLNTASQEQLRALLVLSEDKIVSFLKYRMAYGPLLTVYEMQAIPGWDRTTFDKIIPFVKVADAQSKLNSSIFQRIGQEENAYMLMRMEKTLETSKGFGSEASPAQKFQGSPEKLYTRYRMTRINDFSMGFTLEKDAGESFEWSPSSKKYGFDYWSAHLQLVNKGKIRNLVLGDYQAQFGQGLILGSVFGFGKNAETITTVRRSNLGFLPYTSMNENIFFRGGAISYEVSDHILLHALISSNYKDAVINIAQDDEAVISSFAESGLHRTPAEMLGRKQIKGSDLGAIVQFKYPALDAGLIFHQSDFSSPVFANPSVYNQFSFQGNKNRNVGTYFNYNFANFTFFSEFAQTLGHGNATTAGILGSLSRKAEISLLYRNFSRDYYSFYSNAFSENTQPQNEQGFYWGWKYSFSKRYSTSGYLDLFRFPWLRYRGYAPSEGSEWLLRFNYTPSRNLLIFLQAREESKIRNLSNDTNLYRVDNGIKRNYWINFDYAVTKTLSLKTRIQSSTYDLGGKTTRGLVMAQDISISLTRWSFAFRYALFDTDDYDNRQYLYEQDVWLAYSFPAYDGIGVRNYVLVQFKLTKKIDLWARWAHIRFTDRQEIGSGPDMIEGNTKNDVKFQARIRF